MDSKRPEEGPGSRRRAENVDPLLFHISNILMHALASVLFSRFVFAWRMYIGVEFRRCGTY